MESALKAGIALFNEGYYHAAHDAWEERWLALESGADDERFLHGLIQYTAAVYHEQQGNPEGARGLAESAQEYLAGLEATYRDVALDPLRDQLTKIAKGSATREILRLTYRDRPLTFDDLDDEATWIVANILAAEDDRWSEPTVAAAIDSAHGETTTGRFRVMLRDFVRERARRGLIYGRLEAHLDRERGRNSGIEDLFEDTDQE